MFKRIAARSRRYRLTPKFESCEGRLLLSSVDPVLRVVHAAVAIKPVVEHNSIDINKYSPLQFEGTITRGPNAGATLNGLLTFESMGPKGKITGSFEQSGPIGGGLSTSSTIPVTGQIRGKNVTLVFALPDGIEISGKGTLVVSHDGTKSVTLKGKGSLAASTQSGHHSQSIRGDKGDWTVSFKSSQSAYQYTAITIVNRSSSTISYNFRWGNGATTLYSLAPGYQRLQYIASLNQTGLISFDRVFSPGYALQQYTLSGNNVTFPSGFYFVTPTPGIASGKAYHFANVTGGVQLYTG